MGAVKESMMDCMDMGYVPADAKRVSEWAEKLGDKAYILDGMPVQYRYEGRFGEVDIDVIPLSAALRIGDLLPETYDELGWMIDCFLETRL